MNWVFLYVAIAFEVVGTTFLKLSNGTEKPLLFAIAVGFYTISFYFLSKAIAAMSIGMTYAIWSGVGTLMIVIIGYFWFDEQFTPTRILFMVMIIVGAIGLQLTTSNH